MRNVILLPGIIAPASVRYAPLLAHLADVNAIMKDLEVYASEAPAGMSIQMKSCEFSFARGAIDAVYFERD